MSSTLSRFHKVDTGLIKQVAFIKTGKPELVIYDLHASPRQVLHIQLQELRSLKLILKETSI